LNCVKKLRECAVGAAILFVLFNAVVVRGQSVRACDEDKPFTAQMVEHIESESPAGTELKPDNVGDGNLQARDSNGRYYGGLIVNKVHMPASSGANAADDSKPWTRKGPAIHSMIWIWDCQKGRETQVFPDLKLVRIIPNGFLPSWQRKPGTSLYEFLTRGQVPNRTIEDLGFKEIAGVMTHGYRETVTGTEGEWNGKPTFVMESWVSEDIAEVVLQKIINPKLKTTTTIALTDIKREEPPKSLFETPSDYTVELPTDQKTTSEQKPIN
jgi:hypothetical protein